MKSANWAYGVIGGILSAFSLISLIQHTLHVGLFPLFHDGLEYYRHIAGQFFGALFGWIKWVWPSWHLPPVLRDLLSASCVGAAGLARALSDLFRRGNDEVQAEAVQPTKSVSFIINTALSLMAVISGLLLVGLLAYLVAIMCIIFFLSPGARRGMTKLRSWRYRTIIFSTLGAALGTAVFFVFNAFLLKFST